MASSVALPLEKQFSTIPGLQTISSVNTQGVTSITLEFVSTRDIDAAAVDVQAALLRAQRQLPIELTQLPSYRKVNPADAPVLFIALQSSSMSPAELNDYAENLKLTDFVDHRRRGAGRGVRPEAIRGAREGRRQPAQWHAASRSTNWPTRCAWPTPTRRSARSTDRARR